MHECCYFSMSPENFCWSKVSICKSTGLFSGKQMQLTFVLWFRKHKGCWPNSVALGVKAQTRVCDIHVWLLVCWKEAPMKATIHASALQHWFTLWRVITKWWRQCRHNENASDRENKLKTWLIVNLLINLTDVILLVCVINYY